MIPIKTKEFASLLVGIVAAIVVVLLMCLLHAAWWMTLCAGVVVFVGMTLLTLLKDVYRAGREGRSVFLCPSGDREPELLFYEPLTKAEKDVLLLTAQGVKRKEIARRLQVSERTVSNHLQHIFEKLSVSSSVEAVTKAIRLGYLPPL